MSDEIMLVFGEDGVARKYDDTWDITIHCESGEEQKLVWEKLNNSNREAKNSSNLISRQAAIEALCLACGHDCDKSKFVYNAPQDEQVIMCPEHYALSTLPSAQSEPHWIPISERLPEDWAPVLVTLKKPERLPAWIKAKPENYFHIVDTDVCENGEWSVNKKNVTAWMPLPEPYRAERRTDD